MSFQRHSTKSNSGSSNQNLFANFLFFALTVLPSSVRLKAFDRRKVPHHFPPPKPRNKIQFEISFSAVYSKSLFCRLDGERERPSLQDWTSSSISKFSLNWLNRELMTTRQCWLVGPAWSTFLLVENCWAFLSPFFSIWEIFQSQCPLCHNTMFVLFRVCFPLRTANFSQPVGWGKKVSRKWEKQSSIKVPLAALSTDRIHHMNYLRNSI